MTRELKLTEHSRINMEEKFGNVMFAAVNCNWVINLIISEVKSMQITLQKSMKMHATKISVLKFKSF
jgi:hypothetical protein